MTVDYVTPHTYTVAEISYLEWATVFIAYQSERSAA